MHAVTLQYSSIIQATSIANTWGQGVCVCVGRLGCGGVERCHRHACLTLKIKLRSITFYCIINNQAPPPPPRPPIPSPPNHSPPCCLLLMSMTDWPTCTKQVSDFQSRQAYEGVFAYQSPTTRRDEYHRVCFAFTWFHLPVYFVKVKGFRQARWWHD